MKDAATSNTESTIDAMKKRYIQLALVEAVGGSSAKQDHEPEDSKTRNDGGEADRDGERPRVAAATDQYAIYEHQGHADGSRSISGRDSRDLSRSRRSRRSCKDSDGLDTAPGYAAKPKRLPGWTNVRRTASFDAKRTRRSGR